jgi:hypothetical protein
MPGPVTVFMFLLALGVAALYLAARRRQRRAAQRRENDATEPPR